MQINLNFFFPKQFYNYTYMSQLLSRQIFLKSLWEDDGYCWTKMIEELPYFFNSKKSNSIFFVLMVYNPLWGI